MRTCRHIPVFTLFVYTVGSRAAHHLKVEGLVDLRESTLADQVQQLKSVLKASFDRDAFAEWGQQLAGSLGSAKPYAGSTGHSAGRDCVYSGFYERVPH